VGPRDIFVGGRVAWEGLHERSERASKQAVAEALGRADPAALPPRPPRRITATGVVAYHACPALYRWTHLLGVQEPEPQPVGPGMSGRRSGGLTPIEWGSLCHRALQLAAAPDEKTVAAAVEGALRETAAAAAGAVREELRRALAATLRAFWSSALGTRLAVAKQAFRELEFLFILDGTEINGKIDLVFEGPDGRWEVVDYKSSAPPPDEKRQARADYELQLGLYALAAGRWIGRPVARWVVHYLDSAQADEREVAAQDLASVEGIARGALEGIAAGRYESQHTKTCAKCRCRTLCV
jgi:ATP-dependent exoDNAse (exonuclease V) beta subunit